MSNCVSGFVWIPGLVVSEHGAEDGHDLSSHSDEGDLWLLAVGNEALVEGLEDGIGAAGGERCHVDHPAQSMPAAPDDAATFKGAGVEVVGRQTSERCNLASRGLPDLRRQRQYGMAEDRTGTVEGLDQAILGRERRLAGDEFGHTLG